MNCSTQLKENFSSSILSLFLRKQYVKNTGWCDLHLCWKTKTNKVSWHYICFIAAKPKSKYIWRFYGSNSMLCITLTLQTLLYFRPAFYFFFSKILPALTLFIQIWNLTKKRVFTFYIINIAWFVIQNHVSFFYCILSYCNQTSVGFCIITQSDKDAKNNVSAHTLLPNQTLPKKKSQLQTCILENEVVIITVNYYRSTNLLLVEVRWKKGPRLK